MRHASAAGVAGLLLFVVRAAAAGWLPQTLPAPPVGQSYALEAVDVFGTEDVWAVGSLQNGDSVVLRSTNGGASWTLTFRGDCWNAWQCGNNGVAAVSSSVGWVAGDYGWHLVSTDGGASFARDADGVRIVSPGLRPTYDLEMVEAAEGWVAGWNGADAGLVWHREPDVPPPDPDNPGQWPWRAEIALSNTGMYGIGALDENVAWAVGAYGRIYATTNGGTSWTQQTSNTTVSLEDAEAVNASVAWVVGDGGKILRTDDGGTTWVVQPSGTTMTLKHVAAVDADVAWVVGGNGTILHTTNGGATWVPQASGTTASLLGVDAVDATTAWVVGVGVVLRTNDGGGPTATTTTTASTTSTTGLSTTTTTTTVTSSTVPASSTTTDPGAPQSTTTTTAGAASSTTSPPTTTTVPPCQTSSCLLADAVTGGACAQVAVPRRIARKIEAAIRALDQAAEWPSRAARLGRRARALLRSAGAQAVRAASLRRPTLDPGCAEQLRAVTDAVASTL